MSGQPLITEFMASNESTLMDRHGEYSDWIEIFNAGTATVDLAGYTLTDDPGEIGQWTFPATSLEAGAFLVIFASGDGVPDAAGHLHTNFKLGKGGDYLGLYAPGGSVVSEFMAGGTNYPAQETDQSYGLAFETPTLPATDLVLMGNGMILGEAMEGNGSFEDTDPSSGIGWPNRWAANVPGQTSTVDGWTATCVSGYIGFDNDNTASHGANYAFVNSGAVADFQSAARSVDLVEGDVLTLSYDATVNVTGATVDHAPSLQFGSGGDVPFTPFTFTAGAANQFATRTFLHTVTAAQAGTNTVAVRFRLDNSAAGNDQPRVDNVRLVRSTAAVQTLVAAGDDARMLVPTDDSVDEIWTDPTFDDSSWTLGPTAVGYETSGADYAPYLATGTTVPSGIPGLYLRQTFVLSNATTVSDLTLEIQYDDGFVAYLNGVEVASQNDPANPVYDSIATTDHPDADAVNFVPFSLNDHLGALQDGTNVLSVHALNRFTSSSDLLITPRLVALFGQATLPVVREPHVIGFLDAPTPGGANTEILAGEVQFSHDSGLYSAPFDLVLTPAQPDEIMRYTLDGTEPSDTSILYSAPIPVSDTVQVRARAFGTNGTVGVIQGETYVNMEGALSSFESKLPVIVLENYGQGNPLDKVFRTCFTAVYEPDPVTGVTTLTNGAALAERSAWHRRGSSSFTYEKANYRLEIRDQEDEDLVVEMAGLPDESDWILSTFARFDKAMVRNPIAMDVSTQAGAYAPRTRYVEVFFNHDGDDLEESDYFGVYFLTEKIKRDPNRIDVEELTPAHNEEPELTGGYVLKTDRTDSGDYTFRTSRGLPSVNPMVAVDPDGIELTSAQKTYIKDYVQEAEDALYGPGFLHPSTGLHYGEYFDIDSFIDQHIFQVLFKGPDALRFSTFFHKDRGGKLVCNPIWDQERICGVETDTGTNRARNPEQWLGEGSITQLFHHDWWGKMFDDPDFMQRWVDRWHELGQDVLTDSNLNTLVDGYVGQLDGLPGPVVRNFAFWGPTTIGGAWSDRWPSERLPTSSSPDSNGYYQFADPAVTAGVTDPEIDSAPANIHAYWQSEVSHVRNWLELRLDWIYDNLPGVAPPSLPAGSVSAGSTVDVVPPAGMSINAEIYYTLDGSDPRAPGGGVAAGAILWDGSPIVIHDTSVLTVRVLDPDASNPKNQVNGEPNSFAIWSAPVSTLYEVGATVTGSLRITEINYNPVRPASPAEAAAAGYTSDAFEFVELLNSSASESINLYRAKLVGPGTFAFESTALLPGARGVVVKNRAAFEARYGPGINVLGEWDGTLANDGEKLTIYDGLGDEIMSVDYRDSDPWPISADGVGATLVLTDPEDTPGPELGKHYRWRGSAEPGGTPGAAGAELNGVVINVVLTHTDLPAVDAIELFNATEAPVDISGWCLSDSAGDLFKYEIPAATVLTAGQYVVFDENQFNPTPLDPASNHFAFSGSRGDEVWLVVPDGTGTNVASFVDQLTFGAAFNGEYFGRTPNGAGRLAPMVTNMMGTANGPPRVGPVIVTEVNYHPGDPSPAALLEYPGMTDNDLEFVEIYNPTTEAVDLADRRLRGESDLDFGGGTMLSSGQALVLVPFDPDDPAVAHHEAAFRAHYGIGVGVPLVGPFEGSMDNGTARVELERRDEPPLEDPTFVPHVTEDEVLYDDLTPWPVDADGTGMSLQRKGVALYGNNPFSWYAAAPSPGVFAPWVADAPLITRIVIDVAEQTAQIEWDAASNVVYQVRTRTNPTDDEAWSDLGGTVTGPANTQTDPLAAEPFKLYRVEAP